LALSDLDGANTVMFSHNKAFEVGQFRLTPFRVRHLAADPVAFSISLDSARIGFASDLGSVTQSVVSEMTDADMLFVESNYDEDMLMTGKYPEFLKRAIKSDHGHLSNDDAGRLSSSAATPRTRGIVLVHLSMENNTPDRAKEAVEARFTRSKRVPEITVAEHGMALGPFAIS
jgi:phosphoribosyl 1,2-cyclic phosphodiesterase